MLSCLCYFFIPLMWSRCCPITSVSIFSHSRFEYIIFTTIFSIGSSDWLYYSRDYPPLVYLRMPPWPASQWYGWRTSTFISVLVCWQIGDHLSGTVWWSINTVLVQTWFRKPLLHKMETRCRRTLNCLAVYLLNWPISCISNGLINLPTEIQTGEKWFWNILQPFLN